MNLLILSIIIYFVILILFYIVETSLDDLNIDPIIYIICCVLIALIIYMLCSFTKILSIT